MFMIKGVEHLVTGTQWSEVGDFVIQYGQEILIAALLFLVGLILVKLFLTWLRETLPKYTDNHHAISLVMTGLNILLNVLVLSLTLHFLGIRTLVIWRFLVAVALVAIGFVVLLRPYIPTFPFKIGNTIEVNKVVGKVEAVTII
jgi:small conductance mechanosensitive channel